MKKQKTIVHQKYLMMLLFAFFVITVVLNSILRTNLYNQSLTFIQSIQTNSNQYLDLLMNFISLLVNTKFISIFLTIIYCVYKTKLTVLVYLSYFFINSYILNILKITYQEARPFWYSQKIQKIQWGCPMKFGNPSGHSWMNLLIYEPFVVDFIGVGPYQLGYVLPILTSILVPISRMYLGAHAGNQVIMGLTLGMIMCVFYRMKLQQLLYSFFTKLDQNKIDKLGYLALTIINCIVILIPIIIHIITNDSLPVDNFLLINLNNACKSTFTSSHIQSASLQAHTFIHIAFGFMFGLSVSDSSNYYYLTGQWRFRSIGCFGRFCKFITKLLLQILISFPAPIILSIIGLRTSHINVYIRYLLYCVGNWILGFTLVAFSNRILLKCKIIEHYNLEMSSENFQIKQSKPNTQDQFYQS